MLKALSPGPMIGPRSPRSAPLIKLLVASSSGYYLTYRHWHLSYTTAQTCLWVHYLISLHNGFPLYMGRRLLYHHPRTLLLSPHYNSPKETKRKQNKHLYLFFLLFIILGWFCTFNTHALLKVIIKLILSRLRWLYLSYCSYNAIPSLTVRYLHYTDSSQTPHWQLNKKKLINTISLTERERERLNRK